MTSFKYVPCLYIYAHTPREIITREQSWCPHTKPLCSLSGLCLCCSSPLQPYSKPYSKPEPLGATPGRSCPTERSTEKTTGALKACRLSTSPGSTPDLLTQIFLGVWRVMGAGKPENRITESLSLSLLHEAEPPSPPFRIFFPPRTKIWTFISKSSFKEQDCAM